MVVIAATVVLVLNCGLFVRNIETMTPEEREYWNTITEIRLEGVTRLADIPNVVSTPTAATTENIYAWISDVAGLYRTIPEDYLSRIQTLPPPPLFEEYHRQATSEWVSFKEFGIGFADLLIRLPTRPSSTSEAEIALAEAAVEMLVKKFEGAMDTHDNLLSKELDRINGILRERIEDPEFITSTSVTFRPYLIPVAIRIDSEGGISLAATGNVPTPIGVFSVESAITFTESSTLTVIYQEKRYVYDLGDETFTFEVPEFQGQVKIRYDGKGNVTIELL